MLTAAVTLGPVACQREGIVLRRRPSWSCDHRRSQTRSCAASKRSFGDLHDPWREEERRQTLLKYVQEVQPQSVVQFAEQTHPVVVQAMRQTVLNVVGSLPPQYFEVRISTVAESLAQLMLSIMTTGYMLRSAQFRMELQSSLRQLPAHSSASPAAFAGTATTAPGAAAAAAMPAVVAASHGGSLAAAGSSTVAAFSGSATMDTAAAGGTDGPGAAFLYDGEGSPYAPGVQKKNVEGDVLRWHLARGEVERLSASQYIELLEREVVALRAQVAQPPPGAPSAALPRWPLAPSAPLATAGSVEVLGPDSSTLACVSPLPGFGEGAGAGLPYGPAAPPGNAAAPATMGCGGIPLVVGSPLGLPRNELLDYLHGLQAGGQGGFKELACSPSTASGQAVKEAMELFVARLMGTADPEALTKMNSEFSSVELSKVLFWLMAVGYTLKSIEARLDLEDGAGGGSSGLGGSGGPGTGGGGGSRGSRNGNKGAGGGSGSGSGGGKGGNRNGGFGGLRGLLPGF